MLPENFSVMYLSLMFASVMYVNKFGGKLSF